MITPLAALTPIAGCSLVIGNCDGVHRGHQALLASARRARPQAPVVVLTFEPHPRSYFAQLRGEELPGFRLTDAAQKEALLRRYGADHVVALAFDAALSALTPAAFIEQVIVAGLGAAHVCVGADFAFGAGRGGNVETLRGAGRAYGFEVSALQPVRDDAGLVYGSSRVRAAVAAGDFAQAQALLGHPWLMRGAVLTGAQRGRTLGYPTANQALADLQLPPYGIYAVRARLAGESTWHDGVASLGLRPMFALAAPLLETHIFDFADNIYGKFLEVCPVARLRDEAVFDSLDALAAQMKQDCLAARAVLKSRSL